MDFYKELDKIDRYIPVRDRQEILKYAQKSYHNKLPYRNTANKCVGEYFPDINDKIKLLEYLKEHPTIPELDRIYIKDVLQFKDEYERKGMFFGVLNGFAMLFFPGVRRLPLYKRLPIASFFVFLWSNWGYHYGRDLILVRSRNFIENWERDMGIRHFQLSI